MAKFRKKPIAIEAVQWNGQTIEPAYPGDTRIYEGGIEDRGKGPEPYLVVHTEHGPAIAHLGDWVMYGVNGEVYPCARDTFAETYESAEDEEGNSE